MILYFAYKSMLYTIPRIVFTFFNGYSGHPIYDDYYMALFNILFTSLPLLIRALFEQDVNYVVNALTHKQK
jgi:phospholipid-translocating ATPase